MHRQFGISVPPRLALEPLEDRATPAVTATFAFGVLSVVGDAAANDIVVSADAAGRLQVTSDGEAVPIRSFGRVATTANTLLVAVNGRGGDDAIATDASLGDTAAVLAGGDGNDAVTAGHAGYAALDGGAGDDELTGGAGYNVLLGGAGDDTLDGGGQDGKADLLVGGPGADTFVLHAGENDVILFFNPGEGDTTVGP
jgi:Ca2+-binding RTX toxin-like protein